MLQYYINNQFKRGNKMKLFDNHSHLNDEKFDEDRDEIIREIINTDTKNFYNSRLQFRRFKKSCRNIK